MQIDLLTCFGLLAVASMLACYALENFSAWFVLAFAGICVLGSVCGFLQGAWLFGFVEAIGRSYRCIDGATDLLRLMFHPSKSATK
jgi:hypothetical protein